MIQRLEDKTDGSWRPSPGSVYPMLQLLADEGLAQSVERDGKRVYELTDAGRAETAAADRGLPAAHRGSWRTSSDANFGELRDNARQLLTWRLARSRPPDGPEQVERAVAIVRDARKQLYGLLAED